MPHLFICEFIIIAFAYIILTDIAVFFYMHSSCFIICICLYNWCGDYCVTSKCIFIISDHHFRLYTYIVGANDIVLYPLTIISMACIFMIGTEIIVSHTNASSLWQFIIVTCLYIMLFGANGMVICMLTIISCAVIFMTGSEVIMLYTNAFFMTFHYFVLTIHHYVGC